MNMSRFTPRIILIAIALLTATSGMALDLPTTTIRGRQYFYHKVTSKETVYGISKRFGLTREEIIKYNPEAEDGIRKGSILYFPVDEFADRKGEDTQAELPAATSPVAEEVKVETPVEKETGSNDRIAVEAPVDNTLRPVTTPKVLIEATATSHKEPLIAVMLPFMLDESEMSRRTRLYTDFYKGLLIAADTLSRRGSEVEIYAVDTKGRTDDIAGLFAADEKLRNAAVIIPPDDDATLAAITSEALKNGSFVFNVLNIKDTTYMMNPYAIQANIPHNTMYAKAVKGLKNEFKDCTPVVIRNIAGKKDKSAFIDYLIAEYAAEGIEVLQVEYDSALNRSDLSMIDGDPAGNYVVIPSSGSLAEFNKFCHVIKALQESRRNISPSTGIEPGRLAVFGYPDWTAFRGDALDMLHTLEATVYSRYCDDFTSFPSRTLAGEFNRWFGAPMLESVPSHGILGYDTGCYLIKNIRLNEGQFSPVAPEEFEGIQSTFSFTHPMEPDADHVCGYINDALYILTYQPGSGLTARIY